jgi:hypothetical protein
VRVILFIVLTICWDEWKLIGAGLADELDEVTVDPLSMNSRVMLNSAGLRGGLPARMSSAAR